MIRPEKFLAKTLKGLEPLLAEELNSLGAENTEVVNRGVTFQGGRALLYRVNLGSRLALRVLLPIFRFQASDKSMSFFGRKGFRFRVYSLPDGNSP